MGFGVKMKSQYLPGSDELIAALGVGEEGDVQRFVTDEVARRLPAYVPKKSGALRASVSPLGPATIAVEAEYVRPQFFGVKRDGTPFDYNMASGVKVGPHWDKRLYADEGAAIVEAANRYIRKRSKR